jgi:hypothetical protein
MGERCIGSEYGFTAVDNQIHEVIVGKNATIFAERSLFPLIESHMARFNRDCCFYICWRRLTLTTGLHQHDWRLWKGLINPIQ